MKDESNSLYSELERERIKLEIAETKLRYYEAVQRLKDEFGIELNLK